MNLNNLVFNLSQIVDMDLSDINGHGIIFEQDTKSVKKLLELILEIIYTMNDANNTDHNDGVSINEKIFSDSNVSNNMNINQDDANSELNSGENQKQNFQNQILTSQSNSNFNLNDSPDSILEDEKFKSSNRSNRISQSQSGSYNINNNLKNSRNGFNNEKNSDNYDNDKLQINNKYKLSNDSSKKFSYDIAKNNFTDENTDNENHNNYNNEFEDGSYNNIESKKKNYINEQNEEEEDSQENNNNEIQERLNYSCIDFNFENSKLDKSENLSLNYLYNILIQNNISEEEIQNINNLNQFNFLKSFSEKAILSRKVNYSTSDFSRYILEKNDLQILIDLLSQENQPNLEENPHSVEDFASLLAGGDNKSKIKPYKTNPDKNDHIQIDESKSINISRISEVSKSKENSENHSNKKTKNLFNNNSKTNNINNKKKSEDSSNMKMNSNSNFYKSNDANNLLKNNSLQESFLPSKLSYNESKNEEFINTGEILKNKNKFNQKIEIKELNSLDAYENNQNPNLNYDYNNHTDSVEMNKYLMNESHKLTNSENNQNYSVEYINHQNKIENNYSKNNNQLQPKLNTSNKPKESHRSQSSNKTSKIILGNNKINNGSNKSNNHITQKSNPSSNINNNQSKTKKISNQESNKKVYNVNSINENNKMINKNKSQKKIQKNKNENKNNGSKSEISMSSIHSISQNDISKSNNKINRKNPNFNNNYKEQNISNNQNNPEYYENDNPNITENQTEDNQIQEIPEENQMEAFGSDDNLKQDILKEFRRIYGNKVDKMLLRSQLQNSTNLLDIILNNVKLAKTKMMKLGVNNQDTDDLATKEFFLKYSKELDSILNFVRIEDQKRNKFISKAVNNISNNSNLIKKLQNIDAKRIEQEINRRKKSRDLKNRDHRLKICEEIYSKALELEKKKHLEERQAEAEIRKAENLEKRKKLMQIESYYQDRLAILKDALRREKFEKEIEHRANIQYLSKLQREKRGEFKKQIEDIFNRMDEEDNKYEFKNSRPDVLDKILNIYYNN